MATPSVSIIIPCYQGARTLGRALHSIADAAVARSVVEKGMAIEVLVVLDGPDVSSEAVINSFEPPESVEMRTFTQPHSGIAATRNVGLRHARHPFVTFLDNDDELTAGRLEIVADAKPHFVISHQRLVFDRVPEQPIGLPDFSHKKASTPYLTSMVAPRDLLVNLGGFSEEMPLGNELDLIMRARAEGYLVEFDLRVGTIRHYTGANASLNLVQTRRDYFTILAKLSQRAGQEKEASQMSE